MKKLRFRALAAAAVALCLLVVPFLILAASLVEAAKTASRDFRWECGQGWSALTATLAVLWKAFRKGEPV